MEMKMIKVADIKKAAYNPDSRTDEKKLASVMKSIQDFGMIDPVLVTEKLELIDGHRRTRACELLNIVDVPAVIIKDSSQKEEIYAAIIDTPKKLDARQVLQVYLKEPRAINITSRAKHKRYEEKFGRQVLERLADKNLGIAVLTMAETIYKYTQCESKQFLHKIVDWLLKHNTNHSARIWMQRQKSNLTLHAAIKNDISIEDTQRLEDLKLQESV